MLRHPDYTRQRLANLTRRLWAKIYADQRPVDRLLISPRTGRITCAEAQKLKYRPARFGQHLGPLFATYWFQAEATVPAAWAGRRVDLLWDSHSEATLWVDGRTMQGLNFELVQRLDRSDAILAPRAKPGQKLRFAVEMACNALWGEPSKGVSTYKTVSPFVLEKCQIALFDPDAWQLYFDYLVLQQLEAEQAASPNDLDPAWGGHLLYQLNEFANTVDPDDRGTWEKGRRILRRLYQHKNADCVHQTSAIGHAHIDTAWVWVLDETRRKCERTFSSQLAYMDLYPEYRFSCSQAYQYQLMKDTNPDLYRRIKAKVKAGQWVPVGGAWIEPDCNLTSGESLVRQHLLGQRFFQREFGITCQEGWLPDVFGYSGQLPQILRGRCGGAPRR